ANIDQCFSLYVEGKKIYSFGSPEDYLSSFGTHIVPLDACRNRFLYMRVYSGWGRLGMYANKLEIGSRYEIQKAIFSSELKFIILSFILILSGIIMLSGVFLKADLLQFLSISIFSILLGIYTLIRCEFKQILYGNNYMLWGTADLLNLYIIPVFINLFLCRLFRTTRKNPFSWMMGLSVVYACVSAGAAAVDANLLVPMLLFYFYFIAANVFSIVCFSLYYTIRGDSDAKIILSAVLLAACMAGHDILQEMGLIPMTVFLAPWGQLLMISALSCLSIREGSRSRKGLLVIEKELEIARTIQMTIIPEEVPVATGVSIGVVYHPEKAVGGDLYDFYRAGDGGLGVLIADVAGHGIPAALIASMVNIVFSMNHASAEKPSALMETMNESLIKKCEKRFVTAAYMYIEPDRSCVRFARAGHLPLLIYRRKTCAVEQYLPKGKILGRFKTAACEEIRIPLNRGDRLFLFSDGIVEGRNRSGVFFGMERFERCIKDSAMYDSSRCGAYIAQRADGWSAGSAYPGDDIALLVIDIQ
ncbi:MAG: PP2C family protein-serine/threonine phosphatase, partial [Spirochaetota bacterium]